MVEYIDRFAVLNVIDDAVSNNPLSYTDCINEALESISKILAADMVEVVRCGECKQGKRIRNDCILVSCEMGALVQSEDFFCADGERKDGDGE